MTQTLAPLRHSRQDLGSVLAIQTTALKAVHDFFYSRGFVQVMPVMVSTITDPLCHSVHPASIRYGGQDLMLTKSMIFHKQLALAAGLQRIYCVSPNIRLEQGHLKESGKHLLEFSQVDFEIKDAKMAQVMAIVEDLIISVMQAVKEKHGHELASLGRSLALPQKPFALYDSEDMKEEQGEDFEKILSLRHSQPFWIVNHRREFYDKEEPEGKFRNYDLVYPEGFGEALSGGEREFEHTQIVKRMGALAQEQSFEPYLEMSEAGRLVPSAGGGLGVERLVRFLCGKEHIRDVALFPKVPGERIVF
ncbi:MAG: asparagine synthetase A [Nanoarchaeota archaeon]